jgi:hypothetical protein
MGRGLGMITSPIGFRVRVVDERQRWNQDWSRVQKWPPTSVVATAALEGTLVDQC